MQIEYEREMNQQEVRYDARADRLDSQIQQIVIDHKKKVFNLQKLISVVKNEAESEISELKQDNLLVIGPLKEQLLDQRQACDQAGQKYKSIIQSQKDDIVRLLNKDSSFPRFFPTQVKI